MRKHQGFAIVELLLVLVIVGILGFIAWRVVLFNEPETTIDQSVIVPTIVDVPQDSNDLDTLSQEMDAADVEGSTTVDLESESAF